MVHARLVTMVVVLALGALTLGAGPAAAAQGGNDDTAHACQQGGWANLTDPATGQPFTSQGACVSSGAHGNPPLSASLVASNELGCGGTCWGRITGTGLQPGAGFTWGASSPMFGLAFLGSIGTSLAIGLPPRAIVISSPRSTRLSRRERCVFAACTFVMVMYNKLSPGLSQSRLV